MKKQLGLMVMAAMFSITAVNAQRGGGQRTKPEERIKATMEKNEQGGGGGRRIKPEERIKGTTEKNEQGGGGGRRMRVTKGNQ